ncbi:hypothetical protein CLOM_g1560 [Closterium sp. NIES-68]|nr:hypothetical protein CLOM_g1560 [Closterium sp. NIES-68]GJP81113.1 hypothetical protein CLOP_g11293 [Closterium sp. NIES-67]GJP85956.1 hypothetical protein CLOP_g16042 [Closterium sp. NIES-67]
MAPNSTIIAEEGVRVRKPNTSLTGGLWVNDRIGKKQFKVPRQQKEPTQAVALSKAQFDMLQAMWTKSQGGKQVRVGDDEGAEQAEEEEGDNILNQTLPTASANLAGSSRRKKGAGSSRKKVGSQRAAEADPDESAEDEGASVRTASLLGLGGGRHGGAEQAAAAEDMLNHEWGVGSNSVLAEAVSAMQAQLGEVMKAVSLLSQLPQLVTQIGDLSKMLTEVKSVAAEIRAAQALVRPPPATPIGQGYAEGIPGSVDDVLADDWNAGLAAIAKTIPKSSELSGKLVGVFIQSVSVPIDGNPNSLSMWPDNETVAANAVVRQAIPPSKEPRLAYLLKFSKAHLKTWSRVANRMRAAIIRWGKTVLFAILNIRRSVKDMPKGLNWKVVRPGGRRRSLAKAYALVKPGRFCLVWHCDGKGMPFATWQFEIFLAAALWKFVTGQELRVYPYLLAYALYGAEYPLMAHRENVRGLPTTDQPNKNNADRQHAIVKNWLRESIIQWHGQKGGPVWVEEEQAYQFSAGSHFVIYIIFPPPAEVAAMVEIPVGPVEYPKCSKKRRTATGVAEHNDAEEGWEEAEDVDGDSEDDEEEDEEDEGDEGDF